MNQNQAARLAAVHLAEGEDADALLEDVARALQARGRRVLGFLQRPMPDGRDGCCAALMLEDIRTAARHLITQPLGPGSTSCRLDPRALADLTGQLLADLERGADLLIVNRFGRGETEGHGLRAAIGAAFDRGIPVLTAVRDPYLADWQAFSADLAITLPYDAGAALDWFEAAHAAVLTASAA